jgi:hypothetical protein
VRDEIVHAFDDVIALEGKGVSCKLLPHMPYFIAFQNGKVCSSCLV